MKCQSRGRLGYALMPSAGTGSPSCSCVCHRDGGCVEKLPSVWMGWGWGGSLRPLSCLWAPGLGLSRSGVLPKQRAWVLGSEGSWLSAGLLPGFASTL